MTPAPSESDRPGLTAERVVEVATELAERSQLTSWSIRDLAAELGVVPSVIYHHVGGKDQIARRIVERVASQIARPDPQLPWQEWFRVVLTSARPLALRYPGLSKWLLMHGPTFPTLAPLLDDGVRALERAGFGSLVPFAYSTLFNHSLLTLTLRDDRMMHEGDGPRDHATMMREFEATTGESHGVRVLTRHMVAPMASGGRNAEELSARYYEWQLEVTIRGLEEMLSSDSRLGPDLA